MAIDFGDLTAFVGKNDVGKSTVLEVLDIFFNDGKGSIKIDKDDVNKFFALADDTEIRISAYFEEFPDITIISVMNETTLQAIFKSRYYLGFTC